MIINPELISFLLNNIFGSMCVDFGGCDNIFVVLASEFVNFMTTNYEFLCLFNDHRLASQDCE